MCLSFDFEPTKEGYDKRVSELFCALNQVFSIVLVI